MPLQRMLTKKLERELYTKSSMTSYSYTKIGSITNAGDLELILGKGDVEVSFK